MAKFKNFTNFVRGLCLQCHFFLPRDELSQNWQRANSLRKRILRISMPRTVIIVNTTSSNRLLSNNMARIRNQERTMVHIIPDYDKNVQRSRRRKSAVLEETANALIDAVTMGSSRSPELFLAPRRALGRPGMRIRPNYVREDQAIVSDDENDDFCPNAIAYKRRRTMPSGKLSPTSFKPLSRKPVIASLNHTKIANRYELKPLPSPPLLPRVAAGCVIGV